MTMSALQEYRAKILLADNDDSLRILLGRYLLRAGYQVFEAENGREAIDIAREKKPDLIILEIPLPRVDGLEVCRQLKSDDVTRGIFVIFLSNQADIDSKLNALSIGANDFVSKPFEPRELEVRIEATLRNKIVPKLETAKPANNLAERSAIDIFISHSSQDKAVAEALINLLRDALNIPAHRIRCTSVDGYRLPVGASTDEQLRKEIYAARVLLGLITPTSFQSTYVLFELGARWGAQLPLAPVLASDAEANILRAPLSGLNALSCDEPAQVYQLVDNIASILKTNLGSPASYQRYVDALVQQSKAGKEQARQVTIVGAGAGASVAKIDELRQKNEKLESELAKLRRAQAVGMPNLALMDEKIKVFGEYTISHGRIGTSSYSSSTRDWELEVTWKELFALIAPYLAHYAADSTVKSQLADVLFEKLEAGRPSVRLNDQVFQTIKIQLQALNLVKVERLNTTGGGVGVFWSLTEAGRALMMSLRTVKSEQS